MGRRFDAEKAKRRLNARYNIGGQTVTNAALLQQRQADIDAYKQDLQGRMKAEADKIARENYERDQQRIREYWHEFEQQFASDDSDQNFYNLLSYMLAVCSRVLIERFGWKPVRYANCRKTKTELFAEYVAEEIAALEADETKDIRKYAEDVEKQYGVRFRMTEAE